MATAPALLLSSCCRTALHKALLSITKADPSATRNRKVQPREHSQQPSHPCIDVHLSQPDRCYDLRKPSWRALWAVPVSLASLYGMTSVERSADAAEPNSSTHDHLTGSAAG